MSPGADPGVDRGANGGPLGQGALYAEVEHRRREDHRSRRPGGGMCAPSPEHFSILSSKRRVLVHSGTDKTYC